MPIAAWGAPAKGATVSAKSTSGRIAAWGAGNEPNNPTPEQLAQSRKQQADATAKQAATTQAKQQSNSLFSKVKQNKIDPAYKADLDQKLKAGKINSNQYASIIRGKLNTDTSSEVQDYAKNNPITKAFKNTKDFVNSATASEQVFAKPIARLLPGGQNDLKAENQAIDQNVKNLHTANQMVNSGDSRKVAVGKSLSAQNNKNINNTSQQVAATTKDIKDTTDRKRIAFGGAGTAVDIITAGELPAIKAAGLSAKAAFAANAGTKLTSNAAAGGLNAAAAGGSKGDVIKNAAFGAALPEVLHQGGQVATKGLATAADKLGVGSKTAARDIRNTSLLDRIRKSQGAEPESPTLPQPGEVITPTPQPELHPDTTKALHDTMATVHQPKAALEAQAAQQAATDAAGKQSEQAAKDTEKATADTKKIDQQLEVYDAKAKDAKDGKLSNVDQVKVKQLKEQKAEIAQTLPEQPKDTSTAKADNVITIQDEAGNQSHHELSGAALDEYHQIKEAHDKNVASLKKTKDREYAQKQLKAEGMKFASKKRRLTGQLTTKERSAIVKHEESNYVGKRVTTTVNGKSVTGVIDSKPSFGNIRLKLDDGTTVSVKHSEIPADPRSHAEMLAPHVTKEGVKLYEPAAAAETATKPTPEATASVKPESTPAKPAAAKGASEAPSAKNTPATQSEQKANTKPAKETPTATKPTTPKPETAFKSRVYERLKAEHPDELKDDVSYDAIHLKDQAEKATNLVAEDKQKAYRIATGQEVSSDLTATHANIVLAQKALDEGNEKLYESLTRNRSLAQTRRGQELVSEKASISDNSTDRYVKELLASRMEQLGNKHTFGISLKKVSSKETAVAVIDKEVKKLDTQIRNKKLDTKTALALLDKMECL